ncbi:hypothetical protein [Rhizobium sp. LjRoot254]|uniref:hypothetical protein n=1 Tax=Rhizobium sp. LjRoot254 TaxID=3342297 RepID=UPI003ED0826C
MAADLIDRLIGVLPLLAFFVFYVLWLRKANARSVEVMRINNALLEANLDMVKRLRNIEVLLEKDRQV